MIDWISDKPLEENFRFLHELSRLLADIGGPLTKDLSKLIEEGKYLELVNYQFEYSPGLDIRDAVLARQVHALLSKSKWINLGVDKRRVSKQTFDEMEELCHRTNERLSSLLGVQPHLIARIVRAREICRRILGRVPSMAKLQFSFGPGATTATRMAEANPRVKLNASLACSKESYSVVDGLFSEVPYWILHHSTCRDEVLEHHLNVDGPTSYPVTVDVAIHSGKLSFVPKDARKDRPIIVEPPLNGFVQKGIGRYMKKRLLRMAGVDLTDQTRNQELARVGSIDGSYATIDLSSASDSVSLSVVRLILEPKWFEFLLSWTTGEIQGPDGPRGLEKFSSMGNGFTFELESLLFYSLAKACAELAGSQHEVSVFGDDLIIGTECAASLTEVLNECGFIVNNEKSFTSGPFRESCGADWLLGNEIRPYYWKDQLSERILYTMHNFFLRNGENLLARFVESWTNPEMRLYGPDGYGDGHLIGSYSLRLGRKYRRRGWCGGFFETYALRAKRHKKRYAADWVYPCYSVYTRSGERDRTDPDIVRGSDGYAKVSIYTQAETVWSRTGLVGRPRKEGPEYLDDERLFIV